tara:strand:- start:153 stop:1220 length:1068 start_codon:yes stop_codon:yes gene_type:complete
MSKPSITIGISVYDRINEAKVSALLAKNVLTNHFDVKVVVAACKPMTKIELEGYKFIDHVLEPDIFPEVSFKQNIHTNMGAARTFSSFLKCGLYAQKNSTNFFCFGNAGSWLLNPKGLIELTSKLINENKLVACRAVRELKKYTIEDHFFFVNLKLSLNTYLFQGEFLKRFFNPIFFYENGIHSLLENWINSRTEPGQVMIYSDLTDCKNHFGETVKNLVPFSIDPKRGFMHSNPFDWSDEILTLRSKYIENCVFLDNQLKEKAINLLREETSGKFIRDKIKVGHMYYLDSNSKSRIFYAVIRSKIIWLILSEFSRIMNYIAINIPFTRYFSKKIQRFITRHKDSYDKINFEKIQ